MFLKDAKAEAAARWVALIKKWTEQYEQQGLKAYVVFADPAQKDVIETLGQKHEVKYPLTYFPQGLADDPGARTYRINPTAISTVLLTHRDRVTANFVNAKPEQPKPVEDGIKKMLQL